MARESSRARLDALAPNIAVLQLWVEGAPVRPGPAADAPTVDIPPGTTWNMTQDGDARIGARASGVLINEGATTAHLKLLASPEMEVVIAQDLGARGSLAVTSRGTTGSSVHTCESSSDSPSGNLHCRGQSAGRRAATRLRCLGTSISKSPRVPRRSWTPADSASGCSRSCAIRPKTVGWSRAVSDTRVQRVRSLTSVLWHERIPYASARLVRHSPRIQWPGLLACRPPSAHTRFRGIAARVSLPSRRMDWPHAA